jgi:hypothetical protein
VRAPGLYLVHDLTVQELVPLVAEWSGDGPAGRWTIPSRPHAKVEPQFTVLAGPLSPAPAKDAAVLDRFASLVEADAIATNAPARRTAPANARFEFSAVRVAERFAIAAWLEEELAGDAGDSVRLGDLLEHIRRGERPKS